MLEMDIDVIKGIIFIHLGGEFNKDTFGQFDRELNYLLYKQGMHFFVLDFNSVEKIDPNTFSWLKDKLVEIFLNGGKVVIKGLEERYEKKISKQDEFFYMKERNEYLTI